MDGLVKLLLAAFLVWILFTALQNEKITIPQVTVQSSSGQTTTRNNSKPANTNAANTTTNEQPTTEVIVLTETPIEVAAITEENNTGVVIEPQGMPELPTATPEYVEPTLPPVQENNLTYELRRVNDKGYEMVCLYYIPDNARACWGGGIEPTEEMIKQLNDLVNAGLVTREPIP